jgi:hypothetical protein
MYNLPMKLVTRQLPIGPRQARHGPRRDRKRLLSSGTTIFARSRRDAIAIANAIATLFEVQSQLARHQAVRHTPIPNLLTTTWGTLTIDKIIALNGLPVPHPT